MLTYDLKIVLQGAKNKLPKLLKIIGKLVEKKLIIDLTNLKKVLTLGSLVSY